MDLERLEKKIRSGKGTIDDVYKYAGEIADQAGARIIQAINDEHSNLQASEKELKNIVSPVLKEAHDDVSGLMSIVITEMYKKAGAGLKATIPAYNPFRENDVVEAIMSAIKEVTADG